MGPRILLILLISLMSCCLGGCNTAPLYEVNEASFGASPLRPGAVEAAISRAGRRSGWRIRKVRPGYLVGEFRTAKNKHLAVVDIYYTPTTFSIRYDRSLNLKYQPGRADPADKPLGLPVPGTTKRSGPTIHKVYNQWVAALESAILAEVKPGRVPAPADAVRADTPASACPAPDPESYSAHGVIQSDRVNLRSGPSTRCAKTGFLTRGSAVEIHARHGRWFLISGPEGESWVYSSLVTLAERPSGPAGRPPEPASTAGAPAAAPAPPPVPGKKATIAVIQFKTLNRKAQEVNLGDLVSESFTTALVNSRAFKIIERAQLDKVVKEIELSQTGFIDTSQAVEIGKMLNADAIITGSVALLSGQLQLNARIIDIESAYVLSAESRTLPYRLEEINRGVREIVFSLARKFWERR